MIEHDNTEGVGTGRAEEHGQSTGAAAAPAMQQGAPAMQHAGRTDAAEDVADESSGDVPYLSAGKAFTDWFNDKLHQLPNTQVRLGTKTAQAVTLHPDGRLECSLVAAEGEREQQFVAFEGQYLDQLVRKIAALSL